MLIHELNLQKQNFCLEGGFLGFFGRGGLVCVFFVCLVFLKLLLEYKDFGLQAQNLSSYNAGYNIL